MAKKICLDPGHYGSKYNAGAVSGYYESAIVWKLTMYEKDYLEDMGIEVVLTRNSIDKNPALTTRGKAAKGCDLFVSNHTNACSTPSTDRASVIHLVDRKTTNIDEKSKEFANKIATVVKSTMGLKNVSKVYSKVDTTDRDGNGVKDDNYYGVLHGAFLVGVPGAIVEHSFHTNVNTCKWLMNDNNLKKLAKACAECMAEFVGVNPKATVTPVARPTTSSSNKKVNAKDVVSIVDNAVYYTTGKAVPAWVKKKQWIVKSVSGSRAVIDKSTDGNNAINSAIDVKYLTVVKKSTTTSTNTIKCPLKVKVTVTDLNIRTGAGTNYTKIGDYVKPGVYTITEVKAGKGSKAGWGKLKSGAGWISLDYATKL